MTDRYVHSSEERVFDGAVNPIASVLFNPYYSIADYVKYCFAKDAYSQFIDLADKKIDDVCGVSLDVFDLGKKSEYAFPVYVLLGSDDDYFGVIKSYFDRANATEKKFQYIDGGHVSIMLQS